MQYLKPYAHYLIIFGLAAFLVAAGQLGGKHAAWAEGNQFQTVPTVTPDGGSGGGDGGNDGDTDGGSGPTSKIIGAVTDLSTGQAGTGIKVKINEVVITTDSFGDYSLSGLAAGNYVVDLVLTGEFVAAQEPVTVTVNGTNRVVVDLEYYSSPPAGGVAPKQVTPVVSTPETIDATSTSASATATPNSSTVQSTPTPQSPTALPQSGGPGVTWWVVLVMGLFCLSVGFKLATNRSN